MKVAFRVDSGNHIGSGHVMRCLALADALRRRGAAISFVCREHPGNLIARIEAAAYEVHRLAPSQAQPTAETYASWLGASQDQDIAETLTALGGQSIDWLVTDHYAIDAAWQKQSRVAARRLLIIDDLADRTHDADMVLNQNLSQVPLEESYMGLLTQSCQRLLGPRYALLQSVYGELRKSVPARDGSLRRLLLFFGAHDPSRTALTVLKVLCEAEFAGLALDILVGNDAELGAEARRIIERRSFALLHTPMPSLAALMVRADLAIGAAGSTSWERACLGLPGVIVTLAENQIPGAKALNEQGAAIWLGDARAIGEKEWRTALRALVGDPSRVFNMSAKAWALTDGLGAARTAYAMCSPSEQNLRLRPAAISDEWLLLDWANDPDVRARSFSKTNIDPQQHRAWFVEKMRDTQCAILIAEDEQGLPLGQVRFDGVPSRGEAIVSISIDRVARGRGVGKALLNRALLHWVRKRPDLTPIAEVLEGNTASDVLFSSCGFERIPSRRAGSHTYLYRQ